MCSHNKAGALCRFGQHLHLPEDDRYVEQQLLEEQLLVKLVCQSPIQLLLALQARVFCPEDLRRAHNCVHILAAAQVRRPSCQLGLPGERLHALFQRLVRLAA